MRLSIYNRDEEGYRTPHGKRTDAFGRLEFDYDDQLLFIDMIRWMIENLVYFQNMGGRRLKLAGLTAARFGVKHFKFGQVWLELHYDPSKCRFSSLGLFESVANDAIDELLQDGDSMGPVDLFVGAAAAIMAARNSPDAQTLLGFFRHMSSGEGFDPDVLMARAREFISNN